MDPQTNNNEKFDSSNKLDFSKLVDIEEIQKLQDSFAKASEVNSVIIDQHGNHITKVSMFTNCNSKEGAHWIKAADIIVENQLIAQWMICRKSPIYSVNKEKFRNICDYLSLFANQISNLAYQNIQKSKNIEQLKRAKEELKNSETFISNILDSIEDPIFVKDENYTWVLVNETFCKIMGKPKEYLIGKSEFDILPEKRANDFCLQDHLVFSSNKTNTYEETVTLNNKTRTISTKKSTLIDPISNKKLLVGISRDVTEEKSARDEREKMQKQIFQSAKLASIGELAAGIGHEINNPLFVISGSLEILEQQMQKMGIENDVCKNIIKHQEKAIKRISDIVNGLRTYARSDCDTIENVDVNRNIEKILSFIEVIYDKAGVHIAKDFENKNMNFLGNIGKYQQVLINLLSNAKDATENQSERKITIRTRDEGDFASIKIIDNGSGIHPDNLSKIFDSFFTTKEVGKGTGLGLGIVKNIIENIDGKIDVETEIGKGTTFTVRIPLRQRIERNKIKVDKPSQINPISGRALVVDDEEFIRQILRGFLTRFGLEVDEAKDGLEALNATEKNNYDYIITDLTMPIMNGQELINRLNERADFNSKIIVMTGKVRRDDIDTLPVHGFIGKPFQSRDIYSQLIS